MIFLITEILNNSESIKFNSLYEADFEMKNSTGRDKENSLKFQSLATKNKLFSKIGSGSYKI